MYNDEMNKINLEDEYTEPMECDAFMNVLCLLFTGLALLIYAFNVSHSPRASKEAIGTMFLGIIFKGIIILLIFLKIYN